MINLKDSIFKNQKFILYAIIALCVLVADFYFIVKPVMVNLFKVMPEVSSKASIASIMDLDVKNIPSFENQIKGLEDKLSGYKRKFSTKEEISPLLKSLSDTAKTCGVKIVSINPAAGFGENEAKTQSIYRKFPIFLTATSRYHSFGHFLSKLENLDTFMRVTDLKIAGDATETSNHKFDATIVTYILSAPEAIQEKSK